MSGVLELLSAGGGVHAAADGGTMAGNCSGGIVPGPRGDVDSAGGGSDATASRIAAALRGESAASGFRFHGAVSDLETSGADGAGGGTGTGDGARTITA